MKKQEAHKKTLEFLDKFISTKSDVLEGIINKHTNTIAGPTYAEYLLSLNETNDTVEYFVCQPIDGIDWSELTIAEPIQIQNPPPLSNIRNKKLKKDSVKTQSLSFFV